MMTDQVTTVKTSERLLELGIPAESTLIDLCPHKEVCSRPYSRFGCDALGCAYLAKHMHKIKHDDKLCYKK